MRVILEKDFSTEGMEGPLCRAVLYEVDLEKLRQLQAQNYQDNGIFSSSFSAIINGGPYVIRRVAD